MTDKRTVSVQQAAGELGITKEAVRKRIKRGTLKGYKDEKGQWLVELSSPTVGDKDNFVSRELYEQVKNERDYLRQELERKDHILMSMTRRIPELETTEQKQARENVGWWQRIFGKKN